MDYEEILTFSHFFALFHLQVFRLLVVQAISLLMVCGLQFFNQMILGSLALSFIIAAVIDLTLQVSSVICIHSEKRGL